MLLLLLALMNDMFCSVLYTNKYITNTLQVAPFSFCHRPLSELQGFVLYTTGHVNPRCSRCDHAPLQHVIAHYYRLLEEEKGFFDPVVVMSSLFFGCCCCCLFCSINRLGYINPIDCEGWLCFANLYITIVYYSWPQINKKCDIALEEKEKEMDRERLRDIEMDIWR